MFNHFKSVQNWLQFGLNHVYNCTISLISSNSVKASFFFCKKKYDIV